MTNELEDVLHNYLVLHQRLVEEREAYTKHNAELTRLVIRLTAQIGKLPEVERELKQQVTLSIADAADKTALKTAQQLSKAVMQDAEKSAQELYRASQGVKTFMQTLQERHESTTIFLAVGLFVLPMVVSLLIVHFLMPVPMKALTDQQLTTYQHGQMLDKFWLKLNKKQQTFLTNLAAGKISNRGSNLAQMANDRE